MNLLKNIFLSINTFIVLFILTIISLLVIQYGYYQIMFEKDNLISLLDTVSYLFSTTLILIMFYSVFFYLKTEEYVRRVKSYTKPFEFISLIASSMLTLITILWDYRFIKPNDKLELITFIGNTIEIKREVLNEFNLYFNFFILLDAFLLLIIIFLLLLNFNIEDYKKKNRLYKNYILTKNGWIEGSYKISYDSNEIKVIEPDEVLLVVKAFINFDKIELYEERYPIYHCINMNNNIYRLSKEDFYVEEIELVKKYFDNNIISEYFKKYDHYTLSQDNIKNKEILEKFKDKE